MALSEIALITAGISIAREFFSGTASGALEEIGGKVVNLFQRKLIGGFSKEKIQYKDDLKDEILAAIIRDGDFKIELEKLVTAYQSNIANNVNQSGNVGTTIGVNTVGGDQFFR
jgi:hypothetical protein